MRRGLLPLAAALILVSGCHQQWGGSYSGGGDASAAEASVRAAVPAIEAYYADHGSYAGVTVEILRSQYDNEIGDIRIIALDETSYCIESTADGATYSYESPGGEIAPRAC